MLNRFRWLLLFVVTIVMCACRTPITLHDDGSGRPMPPMLPPQHAKVADALLFDRGDASQAVKSLKRARAIVSGNSSTGSVVPAMADLQVRAADSAQLVRISDADPVAIEEVADAEFVPFDPLPRLADHALRTADPATPDTGLITLSAPTDELSQADDQDVRMAARQRSSELESPFLDDPQPLDVSPTEPLAPDAVFAPPIPGDNQHIESSEFPGEVDAGGSAPLLEAAPAVEYLIDEVPAISGEFVEGWPIDVPDATCLPQAPCAIPGPFQGTYPVEPWRIYHDEYICDGGDAWSSVTVRNDWSLRNLDPEDTVGHYDTLDGRVLVEPSNRVCIYAPRFAATRKVSSAHQNEDYLMPLTADRQLVAVSEDLRQSADQFSQNIEAQRHLLVQPPSEFRDRLPGTIATQRVGLLVLDGDLSAHEDFRVIKFGVHKQAEKARLAEYTQRAITWSRDVTVQVILDETAAQTKFSALGTEQIFSLGVGSPKFRVIKTASVEDALPSEEVEFTLRFDNVGHQVIGNVTIIDNLSTRLEYIQDSAFCTVEAKLVTEANDAGSLTLRWEIAEPLKVGAGGMIRFKCRVR